MRKRSGPTPGASVPDWGSEPPATPKEGYDRLKAALRTIAEHDRDRAMEYLRGAVLALESWARGVRK